MRRFEADRSTNDRCQQSLACEESASEWGDTQRARVVLATREAALDEELRDRCSQRTAYMRSTLSPIDARACGTAAARLHRGGGEAPTAEYLLRLRTEQQICARR